MSQATDLDLIAISRALDAIAASLRVIGCSAPVYSGQVAETLDDVSTLVDEVRRRVGREVNTVSRRGSK